MEVGAETSKVWHEYVPELCSMVSYITWKTIAETGLSSTSNPVWSRRKENNCWSRTMGLGRWVGGVDFSAEPVTRARNDKKIISSPQTHNKFGGRQNFLQNGKWEDQSIIQMHKCISKEG